MGDRFDSVVYNLTCTTPLLKDTELELKLGTLAGETNDFYNDGTMRPGATERREFPE